MKIKVTQKDIDNGKIETASRCPIARAVKRATKANEVHVFPSFNTSNAVITVKRGGKKTDTIKTYVLDEEVYNFLWDFDHGYPVKPFEFTLA